MIIMSMSFERLSMQLKNRVNRLDSAFERHLFNLDQKRYVDIYSLQEGLISSLWQAWCLYCKNIFFGSIRGAITTNGQHIDTPQYLQLTDYELFYVAKLLGDNKVVTQVKQAKPQNEPTWGDVNKLSLIFTHSNTPNSNYVSSPLSSSSLLKDLQMVRNASAHITSHTIKNIKDARVRYSFTKFNHPSDTIFWVEPVSKDYLWKAWIDEIKLISSIMAQ